MSEERKSARRGEDNHKSSTRIEQPVPHRAEGAVGHFALHADHGRLQLASPDLLRLQVHPQKVRILNTDRIRGQWSSRPVVK